jgi:hypothetical protein
LLVCRREKAILQAMVEVVGGVVGGVAVVDV